jgi:hypothetical protein
MIDTELWPGILSWDNLLLAYRKARAGKSAQNEILRYGFNLEYELSHLRQALADHTYRPGPYRRFLVKDRKTRLISAAPFRDRVAQHALLNRLEPELDRLFIEDSYASRTGKGVHAAVRRYRAWANRYAYALKLDIRRYFDSIDHQRLIQKLACAISDPDVLWMFYRIIEASPPPAHPAPVTSPRDDLVDLMQRPLGLPLGNLTSQFLGNFYLNDLDHFVKDTLKVPAYLRYVDDMILLGDDKRHLWAWTAAIEEFLAMERLGLHERKKRLVPVRKGLDVLGYQVFPNATRLSRGSGYRFRRRTKALLAANAAGLCTDATLRCSVNGWLGHALQADTAGLRQALLEGVNLPTGRVAERSPGGSWRFLEQQPQKPSVG